MDGLAMQDDRSACDVVGVPLLDEVSISVSTELLELKMESRLTGKMKEAIDVGRRTQSRV